MRPKWCPTLKPKHLLHLLIPVYGLGNSGDYKQIIMTNPLSNDVFMIPLTGFQELFLHKIQKKPKRSIVNDLIEAGDETFIEKSKITKRKFESKPRH